MKFSTKDQDNDKSGGKCATHFRGAWWYNKCHTSQLNGVNYGNIKKAPYAKGIVWPNRKNPAATLYFSWKTSEMKMVRRQGMKG